MFCGINFTAFVEWHVLDINSFISNGVIAGFKVLRQFQWVSKYELRRRIFNREDELETREADKFN